jgi:hypothetical protein
MTVRDGAEFLQPALASLLRQTLRELQIVVVDDASVDHTPEILAAVSDPRVEVIRSDIPIGVARAKTLGLSHSVGKYVAMMDADDIAVPARLAMQRDFLDSRPEIGLVGSNVVVIDRNDEPVGIRLVPRGPLSARWRLLVGPPFVHPSVMVRRTLLRNLQYRPEYRYSQDYDLWSRILKTANGANIRQPLLLYRAHPGLHSLSGRGSQLVEHDQIVARTIAEQLPELSISAHLSRRIWRFMTGVEIDEPALDEIGLSYLMMAKHFLAKNDGCDGRSDVLRDVAFDVARRFARSPQRSAVRSVFRELIKMDPLAPARCAGRAADAATLRFRSSRILRTAVPQRSPIDEPRPA